MIGVANKALVIMQMLGVRYYVALEMAKVEMSTQQRLSKHPSCKCIYKIDNLKN